jgi:TRAP-type uncharacterized transport system substrate-binding protein
MLAGKFRWLPTGAVALASALLGSMAFAQQKAISIATGGTGGV